MPCICHFLPPFAPPQYFGLPTQYFWQVYASAYISLHISIFPWCRLVKNIGGRSKPKYWRDETKILGRKRVVITVESIGVSQLLGWHVPGFPLKVYAYALYTYRTLPFSICWTDSKKQLHLIFSQTFFIKYMLVQACIVYVTLHCNKENDPNCRFIIH